MALRFYINGSRGGTDGTELSGGNGSSPIMFDGMYPGTSTIGIYRTISIRPDSGEDWRDVMILIKHNQSDPANIRMCFKTDYGNGYYTTLGGVNCTGIAFEYIPDLQLQIMGIYVPRLKANNSNFTIYCFAKTTDTGSPDISAEIVAFGRKLT